MNALASSCHCSVSRVIVFADSPAAEPMDPELSPPSAPESSLTVTLAEGEETRSVHWYLDDGELYRVDQTGWYRVAPGDIHRTLGP